MNNIFGSNADTNVLTTGTSSTTPTKPAPTKTNPTKPSPTKPTPTKTSFVAGQKVTVQKGVNLRSTNNPYSVTRKTSASESGWILFNNPYLNTIEGISGTWVVIYKDVVAFGSSVFGGPSKTNRIYQVVNVNYLS